MFSKTLSGNSKRSSSIIALLIFMMLFNFNYNSSDFPANNQNPDQNPDFLNNVNFPKTSNSDYSSNSSGTGTDVNITLLQSYKNDTVLFMNSSKSNNLSAVVITPTNQMFNTTSSNISISQLNAYNNTYKIQEDQHGLTDQEITENTTVAASFQVPSTCYFSEVIPYFNITTEGNLSILISNSTWNATHERPDVGNYKSDVIFTEILETTSLFSYMTFTTEQTLLDISNTDNNTFFVIFYVPDSNGEFDWKRINENNNIANESFSYETHSHNDWDFIPDGDGVNSSDFCFNFTLSPLNATPNPNQINLRVNQSDIQIWNNTENQGNWISNEIWNGGDSARLNFSFDCSWPNSTWNVNNVEIQYALRTENNQSKFFIPNSDSLVYWNVEYKAEQFNTSEFNDFKINFSVPISWDPIDAYRDESSNQVSFTSVNVSESEKIVQIEISLPYGNNTWFLNLTNPNLKETMELQIDGFDSNFAYFQDIITPAVTFDEEISGDVYLECYYPNGTMVDNLQKKTVSNNDSFSFDPWDPSEDVGINYGLYKIQVKWNNSIDKAILDERELEIYANTSFVIEGYESSSIIKYSSSDIINISLYFEDVQSSAEGDELPIDDAIIYYWIAGTVHNITVNNGTSGYYNFSVQVDDFDVGLNEILITLNKTYYQNHSISYEFIRNSLPTIENVTINPNLTYTNDTLISLILGSNDPDIEDNITFSYHWFKNGDLIEGEIYANLNPSNFQRGDQIIVEVSPYDGYDWGVSQNSSIKLIENFAPIINWINFTEETVYTNDTLSVNIGPVVDIDLDYITFTYRWFKNGSLIEEEVNSTLNPSNFQQNDKIIVEITPYDGFSKGMPLNSSSITINRLGNPKNPSNLNWIWIIPIILAITMPILSYILIKRKKKMPKLGIIVDDFEKYKNIIDDEQNIRMVFIIHKESSVLFAKKLYGLKDETSKSDLISGFLNAVSGWGQEVKKSEKADGLRLLVWNEFSILLNHGEYITAAIVSDSIIRSDEMKERIDSLTNSFEEMYDEEIKSFSGNIKSFEGFSLQIDDILKTHHQYKCKVDYKKLETLEISKSIKKFFQNLSYVQNDFFVIDLIQDITDQKIFKKKNDAYKLLYDFLKDRVIYPDLS